MTENQASDNLVGPSSEYENQVEPSPKPNPLNAKLGFLANPAVALSVGAGALVVGAAVGAAALARKSRSESGSGRSRERFKGITGTQRQYERAGGADVKFTKSGQPYVLDAKGRPRFIKRSKA